MLRLVQGLSLSLVAGIFLSGCGNSSLADRMNISLDPEDQVARVEVDMSDGLEIQLDGDFDIADGYGTLHFEPATRQENAKIVVEFDLAKVVDDQLGGYGVVTKLPNGTDLPVSMSPPLFGIPVIQNGGIQVTALAAIIPELQVGAFIDIEAFNSRNFPVGVTICQNFRNSDNYAYASACLYGPANGRSGGIFIGGNFGDVLDLEDVPAPSPLLAFNQTGLSLRSSAVVASASQLKLSSVSEESELWTESRIDSKKQLRGSKGRKALRNVKRILRAR